MLPLVQAAEIVSAIGIPVRDDAPTSEDEPESSNPAGPELCIGFHRASLPTRRCALCARTRSRTEQRRYRPLVFPQPPGPAPSVRSASQSTGSSTNVRTVGFPQLADVVDAVEVGGKRTWSSSARGGDRGRPGTPEAAFELVGNGRKELDATSKSRHDSPCLDARRLGSHPVERVATRGGKTDVHVVRMR